MSVGKEYLKRIHEALAEFEDAVRRHEEGKKLFSGLLNPEGQVPLQQTLDGAREKVVQVVVDIVTKDRLGR